MVLGSTSDADLEAVAGNITYTGGAVVLQRLAVACSSPPPRWLVYGDNDECREGIPGVTRSQFYLCDGDDGHARDHRSISSTLDLRHEHFL